MPPDSWPSYYEECSCGAVLAQNTGSAEWFIEHAIKWRAEHEHEPPQSSGIVRAIGFPLPEDDDDDYSDRGR